MKYLCPVCNEKLFKLNKKLVCPGESCNFQCATSDYDSGQLSWNMKNCKDSLMWDLNVFDSYPYFISKEYKRLYDLMYDNKLYGVIFQIKDIFEILLKLPILLIVNRYCANRKRGKEEDEIIYSLLNKKLSLGHWYSIAKSCLNIDDDSEIMIILKDIVSVYQSNDITNWRNDTIGHGALLFDDTQSFRDDLESKLMLIKAHLKTCEEQYKSIDLTYKSNKKITKLVGCSLDKAVLRNNGKITFNYAGLKCEIIEFMKVENGGIYFFDSYFKKDKKTKFLNYLDAEMIKLKIQFFDELIKNVSKYIKIDNQKISALEEQIYIESEEIAVEAIDSIDDNIIQEKLKVWINKSISQNIMGTFLLQMEEGMGKTTFTRMLDPHSKNIIKINGVAVRTFYINSSYSFNVEVFKNNIIEKLQHNDTKTDKIKGNIPRFNRESESLRKEFSDILARFLEIYKEKYGVNKLLFIIDGLDEIPVREKCSIIEYIPNTSDLAEGVYVLVTSRTKVENTQYLNEKIEEIGFEDRLEILSHNVEYTNTLKRYIKEKLKITNLDIANSIITNAHYKFIYIRPIYYILKNKSLEEINTNNIFTEYLDILENTYSEKYFNQIIDILVILAVSRDGITISEISYLINREKPDFKLLAFLADINCLMEKGRSIRGSLLSLAHASIKEYIIQKYKDRVKKKCREWIEEVIGLEYKNIEVHQRYLIFNIFYFGAMYSPEQVKELLKSPNMNIDYVYKMFVKPEIDANDVHIILRYIDDMILYMEKEPKVYANKLINAYLTRMQIYISYAFGGNIL